MEGAMFGVQVSRKELHTHIHLKEFISCIKKLKNKWHERFLSKKEINEYHLFLAHLHGSSKLYLPSSNTTMSAFDFI